jgi:hypothetical protein
MKQPTVPLIFSICLLAGCLGSAKKAAYQFSGVEVQQVVSFDPGYKAYCQAEFNSNFEMNAVQASFYGDYQTALDQATKRANVISGTQAINTTEAAGIDKEEQLLRLQAALTNPQVGEEYRASIKKMIELLTAPTATEAFIKAQAVPALSYIAEKARSFHFTLINEAHYNSQNRAFTRELLQPLWDEGYRYLALETLTHIDTSLQKRGYPVLKTGYYTKDSNFGNLVRDALQIGYRLVPYETQNAYDGTLRDRDQADAIYRQTWQKDKTGKVLIHAGYGHISEFGSTSYDPMGAQLKKLANQDILTIDQVAMTALNDSAKMHSYYQEAVTKFDLASPTIFLNGKGQVIVDPITNMGIDMQVYHPATRFVQGRPQWIIKEGIKQVFLPQEMKKYIGYLIQATPENESKEAIPVDQFILSEDKPLLLRPGKYIIRIINCEGELIATSAVTVN